MIIPGETLGESFSFTAIPRAKIACFFPRYRYLLSLIFSIIHEIAGQTEPVAQPVEHRTFNPLVPSSNLGRPTSLKGKLGALAQLVEQRTLNP